MCWCFIWTKHVNVSLFSLFSECLHQLSRSVEKKKKIIRCIQNLCCGGFFKSLNPHTLLYKDAPQLLSGVNPPVSAGAGRPALLHLEEQRLDAEVLPDHWAPHPRSHISSKGSHFSRECPRCDPLRWCGARRLAGEGRGRLDWRTGSFALWLSSVNRRGARQSWAVWGRYEVWWMINASNLTLIVASAATDWENEFRLPKGNFNLFFSSASKVRSCRVLLSFDLREHQLRLVLKAWLSVFPLFDFMSLLISTCYQDSRLSPP